MESNQNNKIVLDQEKLSRLQHRIFFKERENVNTQRMKYSEMVKQIIREITREVENDN